jgi:Hint module
MSELRIGDYAEIHRHHPPPGEDADGSVVYSKVISFSHWDPDSEATYLRIVTTAADAPARWSSSPVPLEISYAHMVLVSDYATVRAADLSVGDILLGGRVVARIEPQQVKSRGLYAPVTEAGSIVVSGVAASSYVALLDLHLLPATVQHHAAHIGHAPIRLLCRYDFDSCC